MRRRFSSYKGSFDYSDYMTIEALVDGVTVIMPRDVEYNMGKGWVAIASGVSTPTLNKGQYISFRGYLLSGSFGTIQISGNCSLRGNCMSLIGKSSLHSYAFADLFYRCPIIEVESGFLPATKLAYSCYTNMFAYCKALTTAPELPATTLANYCYSSMFSDCASLTTAPKLPATTLAMFCYRYMFQNCTSLTTSPELPATALDSNCYESMFSGTNVLPDCSNIDFNSNTVVSSGGLQGLFDGTKVTDNDLYNILPINPKTGKYWLPATKLAHSCYTNMFAYCKALTTAPELPATTLAERCYQYMFYNCTNLTVAPELPATTLADCCYDSMFYVCTSLTTAPELPATTLASNCYQNMFQSCIRLTTGPSVLPATKLDSGCYSYMFNGCISLTKAPDLPATTLASNCYMSMFDGCSKLNYIKMLATDISANYCLTDWVYNVSRTGTFVKNPAMTILPTGNSGIPIGWTVVNAREE